MIKQKPTPISLAGEMDAVFACFLGLNDRDAVNELAETSIGNYGPGRVVVVVGMRSQTTSFGTRF